MNRTLLTDSLRTLCLNRGYSFRTAKEGSIIQPVTSLPMAWLTPPQLSEVEGINRRKESYTVTLHLIAESPKQGQDQIDSLRCSLEEQLLDIFAELSTREGVVVVEQLSIKLPTKPLTTIGEVAMSASAKVVMYRV